MSESKYYTFKFKDKLITVDIEKAKDALNYAWKERCHRKEQEAQANQNLLE